MNVADVTGNWQINTFPPQTTEPSFQYGMAGALTQDANRHVTGMLQVTSSVANCVPAAAGLVAFTGSVDAQSILHLTSAAFAGNVITVEIDAPLNTYFVSSGTFTIAGGACAVATTSLQASAIEPLQESYSGLLVPASDIAPFLQATLQLTGATTPDSTGQYPFTGSGSFTAVDSSLSCIFTVSNIKGEAIGSSFIGTGTVDGQSNVIVTFNGSNNSFSTQIGVSATLGPLTIGGESCGNTSFEGGLNRP
jgi:hypothetical protein